MPTLSLQGAALWAKIALAVIVLFALSPARAADLRFKGCTFQQEAEIQASVAELNSQLENILSWLRGGELRLYVRAWFGPLTTERQLDDALSQLKARISAQPPLIFSCASANVCKPEMMGYAGAHETNLCPEFFSRPRRDGQETQVGMLAHELSHLALNTRDYIYGRAYVRRFAEQNPTLALRNADNYQYFIEAVLNPDPYAGIAQTPDNGCLFAFDGVCDEGMDGRFICLSGTDTADCSAPTPLPHSIYRPSTKTGQSVPEQ